MSETLKIAAVTDWLEQIAPLSYQESYDNAGLLTGSPGQEISKVLISLDCTEDVVDEAIAKGCEMIISHHPIIFGGLKKLTGRSYVERTVIKAIRHGIALYAIHTNLDNVHNGVNEKLAQQIGLKNYKILAPKSGLLKKLVVYIPVDHLDAVRDALFAAGAGRIGNYGECSFGSEGKGTFRPDADASPYVGEQGDRHTEAETRLEVILPAHRQSVVIKALITAHPYEEPAFDILSLDNEHALTGAGMIGELESAMEPEAFLGHLKASLELDMIRYTPVSKKIHKVAVCGGAGSFLLKQAIGAGADAFVTADFKYHEFFDAGTRLMIADIGHYESEKFTKDLLKNLILEKFPKFAVLLSELNTNPIKYY